MWPTHLAVNSTNSFIIGFTLWGLNSSPGRLRSYLLQHSPKIENGAIRQSKEHVPILLYSISCGFFWHNRRRLSAIVRSDSCLATRPVKFSARRRRRISSSLFLGHSWPLHPFRVLCLLCFSFFFSWYFR